MIDPNWIRDGERNGWIMPTAPWWKRLLVIRRIRAVRLAWLIDRHYRECPAGLPTGYDEWVLYGIAHGMERPPEDA